MSHLDALKQVQSSMGMELEPFKRKYLTDAPFHALVAVHCALIQRLREAETRYEACQAWREIAITQADSAQVRIAQLERDMLYVLEVNSALKRSPAVDASTVNYVRERARAALAAVKEK